MSRVRPSARGGRFVIVSMAIVAVAAPLAGTGAAAPTPPTDTAPCARAQTRAAFDSFLAAFDRGDRAKLDSLFAAEPDFQWFSSNAPGPRVRHDAYDRRTLLSYFRARHRRGDRLRLVDFHFTGRSPHWSGFWFDLRRRSRDFRGGHWFRTTGKGAAVCSGGKARFIVLSIGGPITSRQR